MTSRFAKCLVAVAVLAALGVGSATAATVTMNVTADLTKAGMTSTSIKAGNYFGYSAALPLTNPVTVATGDTFELNMDFLGNQQLTVDNLSLAWGLVLTQNYAQPSFINMTGTLDLLGSGGSIVASATKTNNDGSIHIAQVFSGNDFGLPIQLTFAGLRYSGIVNSADVASRTYDGPSLWFQGSSVRVSEFTSNVPEPASLALLGIGLAGLGANSRNRKQSSI